MYGASMAAKKGAEAVITRSLSPVSDDFPRTGTLRYEEGVKQIPALAISTHDADILSESIAKNPNLSNFLFYIRMERNSNRIQSDRRDKRSKKSG